MASIPAPEPPPVKPATGGRDRQPAHRMRGSRLELFDRAGHSPHLGDQLQTLEVCFHKTQPARLHAGMMRELVLAPDPKSACGSILALLDELAAVTQRPDEYRVVFARAA